VSVVGTELGKKQLHFRQGEVRQGVAKLRHPSPHVSVLVK
jgi:hypothetical protein